MIKSYIFIFDIFYLMKPNQEDIHKNLLQWYKRNVSAKKAAENINAFYGNNEISIRNAQKWFKMFREGRQNVLRRKGQGRPKIVNQRDLDRRFEENPTSTTRELAKNICAHQTAWRYLKDSGKKWRKQRQIPHDLKPHQMQKRAEISYRNWNLWKHGRLHLRNIVTHDQTWIFYDGGVCGKQWLQPGQVGNLVPKRDIHGKKQLLCFYWSVIGPLYWELLKTGDTFNSEVYCRHLLSVQAEVQRKRASKEWIGPIKILEDNARPHKSQRSTNHVRNVLGWEVIEHPAYSPDLAPSDFHAFISLKNFIHGRQFRKEDEVKAAIYDYLESKDCEFWKKGIAKLPKRWLEVHNNGGRYLIE